MKKIKREKDTVIHVDLSAPQRSLKKRAVIRVLELVAEQLRAKAGRELDKTLTEMIGASYQMSGGGLDIRGNELTMYFNKGYVVKIVALVERRSRG